MLTRLVLCFFAVAAAAAGPLQAFDLTPEQQAYLVSRDQTLRITYHGNFIPLEFTDSNGEAAGIMPDFVRWMGERIGVRTEFSAAIHSQSRNGVLAGRYDVICSQTYNPDETNGLAFSPVVLRLTSGLFVLPDCPADSLTDLQGQPVAVESPGLLDLLAQRGIRTTPLVCQTLGEQVEAVVSGRAVGLISYESVLNYYLRTERPGLQFRRVESPLITNSICMAAAATNQALLSIFEKTVRESREQGVIRWILRKWTGSDLSLMWLAVNRYMRYIIIGVGLLLAIVLLFWIWDVRLAASVQKKTAQLRSSEERLRTVFQSSPDAIFIEDQNGVVLDANPVACRFHQMSRDELIGTNVLNLVPEEQRDEVKATFKKWFTGELKRYEGFSKNGRNQTVPVEVIGAPIRFEGKSAVLLLVRDMTERQKTEQALKESEMRYRGLIEAQSNLIVRIDLEGRFTFVNEAFCRFVGCGRGELIGESSRRFIHSADLPTPEKAVEALIACRERVVTAEHRMRARTHIAWVRWENIAVFDDDGRVVEIQSVGQDITESRRMTEALQESEKRLRFLFEEIPHIAVQGYNADREVIFWNPASERLYGYRKEEALGRKMEELVVPPARREETLAAFDECFRSGRPIPSGELLKRNRAGEEVAVHSSHLSTLNKRGAWELYVIDVDLSELKRASRELVKAKDFAEQASRAKSEFLANMSHEIRTPMNGVMGMTQLLMNSDLDEEQHDSVQTIMDSTRELIRIIDELLDISRVEAGEVRLHPEPFCMRETVEKAVLLFADRAGRKGVDLSIAIHDSVPDRLLGDTGRIRQVLINLIGNALKFTHDGHIQVRMQAEPDGDQWNVLADVKDTGIGIEPDLQGRIFDKFTQADTSSKREYGGTGLGLAITRQLVELMGGTISVSSTVGKGTTFAFNLKLGRVDEPDSSPPAPQSGSNETTGSVDADILLVEDNLVNQKVASAMLKKLGCRVTAVPNGARALEQLKKAAFDLVFMDCQMPVMDGFEATRAIRQMVGEIREIPIVAMTAHALKEDRQKCLDAGMDDYLAKPVHRDKLIAVLHRYCG